MAFKYCLTVHTGIWYLQFMNEKIGGAKGTELDEDYIEMERVCQGDSLMWSESD